MLKTPALLLLIISLAMLSVAQAPDSSAKALFGAVEFPKPAGSPSPVPGVAKRPNRSHTAAAQQHTGLMYWMELIQPASNQVLRVNSNRTFHSGERIRLHVQSNADGRIMLLQIDPVGTSTVLFPDARVNGGNSHIKAGVDMPIPAANAWLRFDNKPAIERLLVFLVPEPVPSCPAQQDTTGATNDSTERASGDRLLLPPGGKLDARKTAELLAMLQPPGSKSLLVEVDEKSNKPASYVVHADPGKAQSFLAVELRLKHE